MPGELAGRLESASVLHLVYNPTAGRGRAPAALERALRLLDVAGAEYRLHTSEAPGHATELAAATPPGSVVVAVGGDGTVHEVVRGLVLSGPWRRSDGLVPTDPEPLPREERKTLGVIPVGSGDDFAFSIGLDRRDTAAAVARLLAATPRAVDLGWVNGEPFVNSLGVGFDAEVAHRLRLAPSFLKGLAAYLYATMVTLGRSRPASVRAWVDGSEAYSGRSLLVAAQNGPRTGGSFLFAPEARNDDGVLEFVIAGDITVPGTLALLPRVMRGTHLAHPRVTLAEGRALRLEWSEPHYAHTEGEPLPPSACFAVHLEPGGLTVLGEPPSDGTRGADPDGA